MVFVTHFFLQVPFYDIYLLFLFLRLGEQHWETGFITVIEAEKQLQLTVNCWTTHRKRCCWSGLIIPRYLASLSMLVIFVHVQRIFQENSLVGIGASASNSVMLTFLSAHTTFSVHQLPFPRMPNHSVPHPYFPYIYPPYNPHTPWY